MNKFEKTLRFISSKILPGSRFYGTIYLVGGCVRDELLGERYTDLDLLIDLPGGQREFVEYMCSNFPEVCKGPFYYQRYGTTAMDVRIDGSMTLVECVEPHIEEYEEDGVTLIETRFCTLAEDAMRRDYTCNALYKNLATGQILDPTGRGIDDIKARILRTPAEPNQIFRQDPVRMLRGIRFKHQKGFRIDPLAWSAILQQHDEMQISSPKRLRDELNKMLKARTFADGIHDLLITGLLTYVMPGLTECLQHESHLDGMEEGQTLWSHTRTAINVMLREHPHTDNLMKLTVLVIDVSLVFGNETATEILRQAGIGKEKVTSIMHMVQLYQRFASSCSNGQVVARPRFLPRFINGLSSHKDEFRRMVRALNHGLLPHYQLPYEVFYDEDFHPSPRRQSVSHPDRTQAQADRNHRRNIKRREQRKRARRFKNPTADTPSPNS